MDNIYVTKPYLPPFDEYISRIKTIWDRNILTNYGPLHNEFEEKLKNYLNVQNLHYVTNGTISLQLALEALNITEGEIITTPFSFIATSSTIAWQRCKPVFVDINDEDFNIDVTKIENKITKNTKAIMAVHCFGFPCDVDALQNISNKYKIPIIYDAAHAFGITINNRSILSYGDISSCSLHATKVFHSVEGGLCIVNNNSANKKLTAIKNFGNDNGDYNYIGINAKNSEFHSAMGLCTLDHIEEIIAKRKHIYNLYVKYLKGRLIIPEVKKNIKHNYIYFPVLFKDEDELLEVFKKLNENNIFPRRYFYPALNEIEIFDNNTLTPIAHEISKRIACLPFDTYLTEKDIKKITQIILDNLK